MKINKRSTRELMGIEQILDYGLRTAAGDVAFFIIKPTNIGVLPAGSITDRVQGLVKVIRSVDDVELMALNSWGSTLYPLSLSIALLLALGLLRQHRTIRLRHLPEKLRPDFVTFS